MAHVDTMYRPLPIARTPTEHAFLRKFKHPPRYGAHRDQISLIKIISQVFWTLLEIGLFILQPNLFALGFICGIVWDETCHAAVEKIKTVWNEQDFPTKILIGLGSLMALPAVILTSCFLVAAGIGGRCHQELNFD